MPLGRRSHAHAHTHTHTVVGNPHNTFNGSDPSMLVDPSLEALVEPPPPVGIDASTARKAQNRVAQREFRQRKKEYVRALECRVELLSSPRPVQIDRLRWLLRQLMLENAKLRVLLGVLSAQVAASGAGGFLGAHPLVRTELERYVFSHAEQRSINSYNPPSNDQNGRMAMHELAAQTAAPPLQASTAHPHPLLASFEAPPLLRRTRTCPGTCPGTTGKSAEEPALKRRRTIKTERRSPSPVPGPFRRRSLSDPQPHPSAMVQSISGTSANGPPDMLGTCLAQSASTARPGQIDPKSLFAAKYRAHMSLDTTDGPRPDDPSASAAALTSPPPPSENLDLWTGSMSTYASPTLMPTQS